MFPAGIELRSYRDIGCISQPLIGHMIPSRERFWEYENLRAAISWAGVIECRPVPKLDFNISSGINGSSPGSLNGFSIEVPSRVSPRKESIVFISVFWSALEINSPSLLSASTKNSLPCLTNRYWVFGLKVTACAPHIYQASSVKTSNFASG